MTTTMNFGRYIEYIKNIPNPDRTAVRSSGKGIFSGMTVKEFRSRETMARAIRKEQVNACLGDIVWKPMIALKDGEGY
jgi:hypothetical protein